MPIPDSESSPDLALTEQPLGNEPAPQNAKHGACVECLGIVRELEDGRKISGIDYEAFPPMVEAKMSQIATEGAEKFEEHTLKLHHRTGFVPVAEPSVVIRVTTRHSQAAFDICRDYLHRLKTEIPIWKQVIYADE